ncbi:MAG: hypothetical protein ACLSHU_01515 [Oscillospiraceae bacterium]
MAQFLLFFRLLLQQEADTALLSTCVKLTPSLWAAPAALAGAAKPHSKLKPAAGKAGGIAHPSFHTHSPFSRYLAGKWPATPLKIGVGNAN